jgi:hypothetical protein
MIDILFTVIIVGMAVWRLSYAITNEDVFKWLRHLFGAREANEDIVQLGNVVAVRTVIKQTGETRLIRAVGALLSCVYCTSFWIAIIFWGLWINGRAVELRDIIMVFAIAGVAAMIQVWRDS